MKIQLSSKTIEGMAGKIKNLAIQMRFEDGKLIEEEEAEGIYNLEIVGHNTEALTQAVYNFRALFPVE